MRITTNLFAAVGAVLTMASCGQNRTASVPQVEILTSDSIAYCESVLADGDRLLVCNFGTDEFNPLNTEGKGYVLEWKDSTFRTLIPADGNLSGPKGTLIKDSHLFIADVGKMVVYNLDSLSQSPQVIPFPEDELFVNDMALAGDTLYVTVTNTGNIYSLDVAAPSKLDQQALTLYTNVPGANGIVVRDGVMYVASYPPDGVTTDKNVIYVIGDIRTPQPAPLTDRAGQYDGLALSDDGQRLYFTSWVNGEVGYWDFQNRSVQLLDLGDVELSGPARIAVRDGVLYIPDLPASRIVIVR